MYDQLFQASAAEAAVMNWDLDPSPLKLSLAIVNATATHGTRAPSRQSCLISEWWGPSLSTTNPRWEVTNTFPHSDLSE